MNGTPRTVIAIDGPAASGKSSTAQWVAERLEFRHVDSGSLYRGLTAAMLRTSIEPDAWEGPALVAQGSRIALRPDGNPLYRLGAYATAPDGSLAVAGYELRNLATRTEINLYSAAGAPITSIIVPGRMGFGGIAFDGTRVLVLSDGELSLASRSG